MELPEHSGVSPTLGFPWGGNPKWCAPWERTLGFTQPGSFPQVSLFTWRGGSETQLMHLLSFASLFRCLKDNGLNCTDSALYTKFLPIPQEQFQAYWCPQSPPPPPHPPPSSENKKTGEKKINHPLPTAVVGLLGKIAVWQLLQVLRPH